MRGGVMMTNNSDKIEVSPVEYICVFCGSIATFNINGKGACEQCRQELRDMDKIKDNKEEKGV
jgi:DNA-directed RNA polymerase subunit RPC12/RpoP